MSDQITPLPTIDQFAEELVKERRWYDLGIFLCVPTHQLDIIARDYHGTQRCLIELFKCFQSRIRPISWNDIVDVLTKIQHKDLADQLRQKYILQTAPLSPPHNEKLDCEETGSDSRVMETGSVSEAYINNLYNIIKETFAKLVLEIKRALQRKTISTSEIQCVLRVVYDTESLSKEEATLDKVFTRMHQHFCFLNYCILADLINMFLSNEKPLQQHLVDYTNKLEKFKKSVTVKDLMNLIKEKRNLCGNYKTVQLKTRDFWGEVPLSKFERLAELIFENLYECAAQIRVEDGGCICVSWVIPDIDTGVLDMVSPDLLKVLGVISLKIDDRVIYERPNEGCRILESAFLQAVEVGNIRAVELLLTISTHPSEIANMAIHNGWTPLMIGSQNGHSVVVSTLLTSGADPNMADSNGWTPLMIGSHNGHNEVVQILLKAKVNPNAHLKDGRAAIHIASDNCHHVVVSTLLAFGADRFSEDREGYTHPIIGSYTNSYLVIHVYVPIYI